MIEDGRLRREDTCADYYDWLAESLAQLAVMCDRVGLGEGCLETHETREA